MQIENWNDLRFLLALQRQGTLIGAARELGVDQTTVTRRLRSLEKATGSELFGRHRSGAVLTRLGAEMVITAERLEMEMLNLEARVLGGEPRLEGPVRITMPLAYATDFTKEIAEFARIYPGIELEVVGSDRLRSLTKREADIALRIATKLKVPEHLVGRKICPGSVAVFGAPHLVEVPWEQCPWLGWIDPEGEWSINEKFRERYGGRCVLRLNDLWAMTEAARAGVGVMVHGCGTPLVTQGLVQMTEPEHFGDTWVLTHPELRRSPRIRATLDYWYGVLERRAPAFAGLA
jgi:DNA-binding transcriptional LysR family regulator